MCEKEKKHKKFGGFQYISYLCIAFRKGRLAQLV